MSYLERVFLGNAVSVWLVAAGIALVAMAALLGLRSFVASRLLRLAGRTETVLDDVIAEALGTTKAIFLALVAVFLGSLALDLPAELAAALTRIAILAVLIQGGLWVSVLLTSWMRRYRDARLEEDAATVTTMSALTFVGKLVLWTVVLLLVLDNLGVDVTALVAGLGVGGIAVALAVQNILGDLFASLSIVLDKPFVIGDFVIVGDFLGRVEHIGLKTTRLRSLGGEQLVFSNADLLQSRLRNYGRMMERRVLFQVGVAYETSRDRLERIPTMIREAIGRHEATRFDRSHFKEYGDSSLVFETVYYVLSPEYNIYMDIQEAVNLEIHRRFEQEGIEFAYPTRTLHLRSTPADGVGFLRSSEA